MTDNQVRFVWKGVAYVIPIDTRSIMLNRILLPNGNVLRFDELLDSHPPKLNKLVSLGFSVTIEPDTDLEIVAVNLQAMLAVELGFCPDHPDQTGNYCSVCGKKISSQSAYKGPKPFPFMTTSSVLEVMGYGPCPHCHQKLNHGKDHGKDCPHCGGKLKWVCR